MDETAAPAVAAPRSIGERLRAGRERSGLSVAAAAEKLHLDPKVIESLEADRFNELGASVYVRGHLRRYADFVGEPGVEMVQSYVTARDARPPTPDLARIPKFEHRPDPRRFATPLLGLAGIAVLSLAIWWVTSRVKTPATRGESPAVVTVEDEAMPVAQPDPAPTFSGDPAAGTPVSPVAADAAATPATTPAATPQRREEAAPARETHIMLALTNDSWVEVYDARGERLFYDVASAGSVQNLTGRGPLRVVLGNAAGVSVEVDGQSREIPGNAAEGEGARFVVNRSGSLSRSR